MKTATQNFLFWFFLVLGIIFFVLIPFNTHVFWYLFGLSLLSEIVGLIIIIYSKEEINNIEEMKGGNEK